MHLTYLILAHQNPTQLLRLVDALSNKNTSFVVHIDARVHLDFFLRIFSEYKDRKQIFFVENRCETSWASFELVQATLNSLLFIKDQLPYTERVIFLSGQDYPIKDQKYIHSYLSSNPNSIFIQHFKIPFKHWSGGGIPRFPFFTEIRNSLALYGGSQWMSLPSFVLPILFEFLEANPDFITYFKSVTVPDESFFQTLFLNSGSDIILQNLVNSGLHLIKWDPPYMHPRSQTDDNFWSIKKSKHLFARKFPFNTSSRVLDRIDTELLKVDGAQDKSQDTLGNKSFDNCILFVTDKNSSDILNAYSELRAQASEFGDTVLVYHQKNKTLAKNLLGFLPFIFDNSILKDLGFKSLGEKLVPGSNHFPLFKFYRQYPHFDYYWCIEDDVKFNNGWDRFFGYFSANNIVSDFLTSHIRTYENEPHWHWWESIGSQQMNGIPKSMRLRSFNPIFRISNKALSFLDNAFTAGWWGHHEVTIPTLLYHAGFTINDFGGSGEFVLAGCTDKFYEPSLSDPNGGMQSGSMRFRPYIKKEEMTRSILYHPVKAISGDVLDWQKDE